MKNILFTKFFVTLLIIGSCNSVAQPLKYILKLQFPSAITETAGLYGYYKGSALDLHEHWCILPESQEVCAFSIVITPEVTFKAVGNNVKYIQRVKNQPCLWFDITLKIQTTDKKPMVYWDIQQKQLDEVPLRVPDHTILIFMNPDLVDTVRADESKGREKTNVISLPTIVLKKDLTMEQLEETINYTLLALPDLKPILGMASEV